MINIDRYRDKFIPKGKPSRSDSTHRKRALLNFFAYIPGRRIIMHSRSLWLSPTMSSCSPAMPTRELDSLEESLLGAFSVSFSSRGAFFFCVFGVVTNARRAHTIGVLVEESICKN
jgi:hypothetical protein